MLSEERKEKLDRATKEVSGIINFAEDVGLDVNKLKLRILQDAMIRCQNDEEISVMTAKTFIMLLRETLNF